MCRAESELEAACYTALVWCALELICDGARYLLLDE